VEGDATSQVDGVSFENSQPHDSSFGELGMEAAVEAENVLLIVSWNPDPVVDDVDPKLFAARGLESVRAPSARAWTGRCT
jgi:hypothetical protein